MGGRIRRDSHHPGFVQASTNRLSASFPDPLDKLHGIAAATFVGRLSVGDGGVAGPECRDGLLLVARHPLQREVAAVAQSPVASAGELGSAIPTATGSAGWPRLTPLEEEVRARPLRIGTNPTPGLSDKPGQERSPALTWGVAME